MITKKEVERVAKLARIGITKKEEEKFAGELSLILDYVEKLKEVDISKTLPTSHSITRVLAKGEDERGSSTEIENVTREDHAQISKKLGLAGKEKIAEKLLKLAPETKNGYLKVKSIL